MRIVLITETFIPKVDGIVTTLCQTIKQLKALGHEVLIFAAEGGPEGGPESDIVEFEQCRVVKMSSWAFPLYPDLRLAFPHAFMGGMIADFKADILHVAEPFVLGSAGLYYGGGKHGGALGLPLVTSYHTDLPKYVHYYRLWFMAPFEWRILRFRHNRSSVTLCTSATMLEELTAHGIERVALWPGGVDAGLFEPSRRSAEMRFRLTEGHPESPLLLCVGRLSAEKDLESLRPMLEAFPGARLALVGDGPHHEALEEHFAGLPVYMPGFLHKEELASAYASSDIFVMPSRTETLGLVVLEAMSSGLPVVAARAGGIPEMIEDGVSGILYDDEARAIEAIGELLASPEKRATLGAAARERSSHFSWKAATVKLVEQYEAAIGYQPIVPNPPPEPGWRYRARKALIRATLFVLRKLFP
jgi:glycosyltransferase involved in cell wall biosynthesis